MGYARADSSRARAALRGFAGAFEWAVRDGVEVASHLAENAARSTTAWKNQTGKTRQSIKATLYKNGLSFKLVGKGASLFLEEGTKAHGPRTAKFMRFVIGGTVIFAKWVKGITPTYFLRNAVQEGAQAMSRNLPRVLEREAARRGLGR